ncbi:DUF4326 domain-containing protein [Cryobacterium sp. PH31-AA6]|uniref:DUF4326 domain-containing protein n=1 Tax=Cryobacterium sp. PH31-AA6 TaxID=3046205 RepID=UPI0024B920B2|nr:DUF4326 domain-containing protein [Cryobacterium sp. PH31-AA6]MDJ0323187.1 DUF4326 domain-containing protein [Cryobacterium sp. PH31-AA6]
MPKRIWHSRGAGWKLPPNTVKVSRRTKWGNPFAKRVRGGEDGQATMTREMFADEYREWLTKETRLNRNRDGDLVQMRLACYPNMLGVPFEGRPTIAEIQSELRGKDLACDCHMSQPCHADVLLEIANT